MVKRGFRFTNHLPQGVRLDQFRNSYNLTSNQRRQQQGLLIDCVNNVLSTRTMPPASLALSCFLLHTHSLCCGLEEYRQLRWLASTFVHCSSIGLYLCSDQ